ncbi:MAG: glycosyltransferase family 4 protein [Treponema sp.]|nr:glycosyltransferase family 4 protein [Treponema sp.]
MKIGIDTFASAGGRSGVGVYLLELLKRLPSNAKFEFFGWDYDRYIYTDAAPSCEYVSRCRFNGRTASMLWHLLRYPSFALNRDYKTCFFPAAHRNIPHHSPCLAIGTVHDMAGYWGTRKTRESLGLIRMILPDLLRHLDRIIAVSEFVKQELIDLVNVRESNITVIPNGVDTNVFYPRSRNEESVVLIQPFSFSRPYILYAARLDHPVKNHVNLIKAFGIFKERTKFPHRLVLAGGDSRNADIVKYNVSVSKYRSDIFLTGHFPFTSLPELYAGADFVVYPSMYEGFGLGVLEAMASGVPVACARAASLPEAADHAALYFDPADPEEMADRMVDLTDRELAYSLSQKGLERARAFSWDECAKKTFSLILE